MVLVQQWSRDDATMNVFRSTKDAHFFSSPGSKANNKERKVDCFSAAPSGRFSAEC